MNFGFVKNAANAAARISAKAGRFVSVKSPEILLGAGIIAGVAAVATAFMAKNDVDEIVEEGKAEIYEAENHISDEYTEKDLKKDVLKIKVKTAAKVGKRLFVTILLIAAFVVCVLKSHNILSNRYLQSAAAYTAIDQSFKEYRSRVVDKFGEEVDYQLKHGTSTEKVEEETTDEKGKTKKTKKSVEVADKNTEDIYTRYFTKSNPNWDDNDENVKWFFSCQQRYLNDRFKTRGYMTLNEALETLDMKATNAGLVVGWICDYDNPTGDNYIQLQVKPVKLRNEFGELEDAYSVEFNCDGQIYEKLR